VVVLVGKLLGNPVGRVAVALLLQVPEQQAKAIQVELPLAAQAAAQVAFRPHTVAAAIHKMADLAPNGLQGRVFIMQAVVLVLLTMSLPAVDWAAVAEIVLEMVL
jgi:hypothetical protein